MADWTEDDLHLGLKRLGVEPGVVLFVQASLRRVGPVVGGGAAVLSALRVAVGDTGTLVVYTATPENSLTSPLYRAATSGLDAAALAAYHEAMPAFERHSTPCSPSMGRLSEELRLTPGALRSAHPQTSFAALGPRAAEITFEHPLEQHLGPDSPLGRLYALRAQALLLGTGPRTFTPFHLIDYQRGDHPRKRYSAKVRGEDGRVVWRHFTGLDFDDAHFGELGRRVEPQVRVRYGRVGSAPAALVPLRAAVDTAAALQSYNAPVGQVAVR
jgi:aminoglycoside 3-N-acetyltransferase